MLTVLVDYESGNLHSAQKAFERMAAETGGGTVRVSVITKDDGSTGLKLDSLAEDAPVKPKKEEPEALPAPLKKAKPAKAAKPAAKGKPAPKGSGDEAPAPGPDDKGPQRKRPGIPQVPRKG